MSVSYYNKDTGELVPIVAKETLYADAPIGSIQAYGGTTAPSGWLLCQGQAVSRTTYADLFAAIGTAFGTGDGSTTFNVPDLRDKAVMGAGTNGALGASQSAQLPNITGKIDNKSGTFGVMGFSSSTNSFNGALIGSEAKGAVYTGQQSTSACKVVTFDASHSDASIDINGNNVYTNNGETRPANVRLNYIIKAKQVAVPTDFADSLVGYVGQETNYNLYSWSNTRTSANPATYLDFTVEKDGWYSVDFTLEQSDGDVNGFAIRDFDAQGETHTIGRGEIKGCIRYRSNIIVPLKAGMYRYQHNGVGSLSVYMNRRDFA
jgi:microcystin-dependent protein